MPIASQPCKSINDLKADMYPCTTLLCVEARQVSHEEKDAELDVEVGRQNEAERADSEIGEEEKKNVVYVDLRGASPEGDAVQATVIYKLGKESLAAGKTRMSCFLSTRS